jgi:hypothetical protein
MNEPISLSETQRQELLPMNRADPVPVVYSTVAPDALVRLLEVDYDLGSPVECKFWNRGFNDHYLVTARDKKYGSSVVRVQDLR